MIYFFEETEDDIFKIYHFIIVLLLSVISYHHGMVHSYTFLLHVHTLELMCKCIHL